MEWSGNDFWCGLKKKRRKKENRLLLGLLGVLDGEAPDIKVVAEVVDDVDRKVGVGCSREGETAPQVNVLHMRSKHPLANMA